MSIWSVAIARMRSLVARTPAPGGDAPTRQLPARGDAWVNSYTGLGTSTYDGSAQTYFATYDLTSRTDTIRKLLRSNAIARKIAQKQVLLAWGSGLTWSVTGGGDDADQVLSDELLRLDLRSKVQKARYLGRAFGGALLLLSVDDGLDPSDPLDLGRVRRLLYIRPLDRWDVYRIEYDTSGGVRDGEPEFYTISAGSTRVRVHHSRVVRFTGIDGDRVTEQQLGGWGDSVLQPVYESIRDIDSGGQSLSSQLQTAVQSVYKIKGLHEQILAGNREFVEDWIASLELFRSHLRAVGLDADNEDLTYLSRPLGDAVKVYEALQARVSAAADMPQIEIFGESPSGMSTDDLGSTRRYYDKIEAEEQQGQQGRCLDYLLPILSAQSDLPALDGSVISYEWPSLYSPTAKEKADLIRTKAETVRILVETGDLIAGDFRSQAATLLGIDLKDAIEEEQDEESGPSSTIVDPTERLLQARLAIGSGLLHLPDTAQTFRPILGLDPLTDKATDEWFRLVKTSLGEVQQPSSIEDTDDLEEDKGDAYRPLLVRRITKTFSQQAARLARGQASISYDRLRPQVLQALRGLAAADQTELMAYFEEQWDELPKDVAAFKAVREARGEEPAAADIVALVKTRTRLRTEHLDRRLDQAHTRTDMASTGSTMFVWKTMGDSSVRPEHRELDGQLLPLATGDEAEGFPGDAPGCRCVAVLPSAEEVG